MPLFGRSNRQQPLNARSEEIGIMAKAPASDSIMAPDKMKPLLALSKREPVQAAIGLTADGEGVILLDKRAKPKKCVSLLKASAAKAKLQLNAGSLRFGRAEVDTDYDSAMVRFFVNKETAGNVRMKLVEVVKRIPYQKVEINVDPSLEDEPEEDEDGTPAAEAARTSEATGETSAASVPPAPPPPPVATPRAGTPAPEEAAQLSAVALRADLIGLIKAIATTAGSDAARRASLVAIASEGNDALKGNNLAAAAQAIARLREAMAGNGAAPDATAEPTSDAAAAPDSVAASVPWDKVSAAWAAARAAAEAAAKPIVSEMQLLAPGTATGVENVLNSYGGEMEGFLKSASGAAVEAGVGQVQGVIDALRSEMAGDKLFAYLDGNGISVRPAFLAGFDQIEALLRPAAGA
jgi:hypothetical protein